MSAVMMASTVLASGCVVRARARATAEPVYVVEEAPPPPREERVTPRAGYVWVRGYWEYRGNQWTWKSGHWERTRTGYEWQPGHWERRGSRYHWVEGQWVAAGSGTVHVDHRTREPEVETRDHRSSPTVTTRDHRTDTVEVRAYPVEPPPAPRAEKVATRSGYVWVPGYYKWEAGAYVWVDGHWERARKDKVWEPGRWERRGDRYVWIEGRWTAAPKVKVRDHRSN
ncbi:MAG TPA: YXWGXW repeat-containing protein [Kofleriaceae bacterium]|nr:YXWGXW repeat-containing protein [Kofleriaceae bacterium]